jgi:hypothetical protein
VSKKSKNIIISSAQRDRKGQQIRKRGFLKLSEGCKEILNALRKRNLRYGEIRKITGLPRGTLDRYLAFLKDLGLIGYDCKSRKYFKYSPGSLESAVASRIERLMASHYGVQAIGICDTAEELGIPPDNQKLKEAIYKVAKEYGIKVEERDELVGGVGAIP